MPSPSSFPSQRKYRTSISASSRSQNLEGPDWPLSGLKFCSRDAPSESNPLGWEPLRNGGMLRLHSRLPRADGIAAVNKPWRLDSFCKLVLNDFAAKNHRLAA
jgi:hypothetical protein